MFLSLFAIAAMAWQAEISSEGGLARIEFTHASGRITVYLPDDLRAGDTISGTVLPEPANGTNGLKDVTVELDARVVSGSFRAKLNGAGLVRIGVGTTTVQLPVDRASPSSADFWSAPVMQQGRPVQISGAFDGDSSNTRVSVGGVAAIVVAESPRSSICLSGVRAQGPVKIEGNEAGRKFNLTSVCTNLRLTTGQRTMLKGQRTTLRVDVTGLASVPESEYPLSLELHNLSPTVVSMSGPAGNDRAFSIQFTDVKQGVWSRSFDVVALADGPYLISGILFGVKIHDLKMALDAEQLAALIDATIASTQAKKDKKVADGANDWTINHFKKKLETLKNARDTLPDLNGARDLFDKAQADFTFFEMAGELIDFAAEMLGYKDLPLPGIGHALKVLKVASKKIPKAVELLEKAEKVVEKLGELEEGAEKVEKIEEAKKLLDKVKEEIGKD
ncbi:MAG: hypothetical protein IT363_13345 [Methanoregulaceae archaeon]|nr:hypothetical protein [Methanoregulaceae archaeon]